MNTWRKRITDHKSISWLLVAAILLVTFLPAHYHLHHLFSDNSVTDTQIVDLHLITDKTGQSHHNDDAKVFAAAPNGMLKNWGGEKNNPESSPFILLAVLLVLFPLSNYRSRPQPDYRVIDYKQTYYQISPPLRAPPLH